MGTGNEDMREDKSRFKSLQDDRVASSRMAHIMKYKVLHKVSNSRTQLLMLFGAFFWMVNYCQWFEHPTDSMITDLRRY